MMEYSRGDVVLVNFNPRKKPEKIAKVRPAVIVSDSSLNDVIDLVTLIAMTTNLIDDAEPLRIRIEPRERLERASDVMMEQIRSVSKQRIGEKLTTLDADELGRVEAGMRAMLQL
jgi:mRNA interferase MazF